MQVIVAGFLYNRDDFFIGASVPNLLGSRAASRKDIALSTPVYGYAGYRFYVDRSETIFLKPGALVKYEKGAPIQIDINLAATRSEKHTSELQSLMRTSYAVFCLKKKIS